VLQVEGQPAFAAVSDEIVEGNVLQVVEIFTGPWPVTGYYRQGVYRLLKDVLDPELWQGPDPEGSPPIPLAAHLPRLGSARGASRRVAIVGGDDRCRGYRCRGRGGD
jgi:hypothetical protein